ncbi:DNA repair endonuclease XPF [Armadillidium nasatum]|uniref:DNA repair endonuclease XPF n=1 Tax=Armadillidium nasatum TaxID=96803 RepID=A0A5N5SUN1_9CRUS|nr:DNA repair endonuclease XPF [Armadillidium nasatum]
MLFLGPQPVVNSCNVCESHLPCQSSYNVWQARNEHAQCRVYFLIYKGTVEEQIYLTNIKREKNAFEFLIKEKASMVIPEYADGRNDDHPDLLRDSFDKNDEKSKNDLTRKAGGSSLEEVITPRIIVDMREFRSDLPSMLHKKGIEIDPATIEVGDYILTPEVCVERKSISDLIGSLSSGRLYNQAQAMTRYYKKPILLIEFDHNKPFHLQGRLFLSSDPSSSSKEVSAKLQLLTLHFPYLRIIWSPSPFATAEVFYMLKKGKPEPSVAEAQAVNKDTNPDFASENFNPLVKDFIAKLPGVTTKNINSILRNVKDIPHLLTFSFEEINQLLENSKNAKLLYEALHSVMKEPNQSENLVGKRTKFGKKALRRK